MIDYSFDSCGKVVPKGCFADFIKHLVESEGLEAVYCPVKSSELDTLLMMDKVDLIPCTFETERRSQFGDFAAFLYTTRVEGVCRKKGRKVFTQEDLHRPDVTIVLSKGEIGWEFALDNLDLAKNPYRRFFVSEHERVEDMMHLVAAGDYDVALADALSCRIFCRDNPRSAALAFAYRPEDVLSVRRVGTMIPKGDLQYADWITEKFRIARRAPEVQLAEKEALEKSLGAFTTRPL